jgi:hypothetical protein
MTCGEWSARVRWCLWPSAAIVTQLVTRPPESSWLTVSAADHHGIWPVCGAARGRLPLGHSRVEQGRASSALLSGLRQVFGNASDLRFLISTLLMVSGIFPQRCALIVPAGVTLYRHDDLPRRSAVRPLGTLVRIGSTRDGRGLDSPSVSDRLRRMRPGRPQGYSYTLRRG